jgi:hypothetical protein
MNRFKSQRARDAYESRFVRGVPDHISIDAHKTIHALIAARSLQDVGILGRIICWKKAPGEYGLFLSGKWHVLFRWSDDFGPYEIDLGRR